jgi:hypothetical protein
MTPADEGIADWMERRRREVEGFSEAETKGRDAWNASTLSGQNLRAPRLSDVRALGAGATKQNASVVFLDPDGARPEPIRRGDKAVLTDDQIANIIFNETRSLSGEGIQAARERIAHAVINGDEAAGSARPGSAPTAASVPQVEAGAYKSAQDAVAAARTQRANGVDPTDGATHFNFRKNDWRGNFLRDYSIHTQSGPFSNSNPQPGGLPASGVYSNTYDD